MQVDSLIPQSMEARAASRHDDRAKAQNVDVGKPGANTADMRNPPLQDYATGCRNLLCQFSSEAPISTVIRHQKLLELIKVFPSFVNVKKLE